MEILPIMKPIDILLDSLDDVVESFTQAIGHSVLEEVENAEAPAVEHLDVVEDFWDVAFLGAALPVAEFSPSLLGIESAEDGAQILFEHVGGVQGFVGGKPEQVFETNALFSIQVFPWTQEQVTTTLEVTSPIGWKFALHPPPNVVDRKTQRLDDVEMIIDDFDSSAARPDLLLVGIVHVDDDALEPPRPLLAEPVEKLFQDSSVSVASNPENAPLP